MSAQGRGFAIVLCLGFGAPALVLDAGAQGFPNRPIRVVVPFAPGGGTDTNARIIAQWLGERLGVSVVVDNRPGAGSVLGTGIVARASPDGHTLLLGSSEFTVNPSLLPKLPYDPIKHFTPITQSVWSQYALSTHPSVPVKSVKEFIAYAKARPGELNYGSAGVGSASHLAGELFQSMAGIKLVHIPFKGAGPAAVALIGGEINFLFSSTTAAVVQAKAGKLRPLAVTGPQRFSEMPDVPTVAEAGVPGFLITGWFGMLAPAGTPRDIIDRLHAEIVKIVHLPAVRERFAAIGTVPVGSPPEEFGKFLLTEMEKWAKVVKASGARPD